MSVLLQRRGGMAQDMWIDPRDASFALNPFIYYRRNGHPSRLFEQQSATPRPIRHRRRSGDRGRCPRPAAIGRDCCGSSGYRKPRGGREAVRAWKADELEDAAVELGVPVAVLRTTPEWRSSEQGKLLALTPLGRIDLVGPAEPVALSQVDEPLAGIRVLDMTHVVAGPTITRALAEYGADVLHVASLNPDLQDELEVATQLGIGKRSAQIELDDPGDQARFEELIRTADVFVQSWRPGVLARHGFSPERIAELNPGIVQLTVSAYGETGPWGGRAGYDGLALSSIGARLETTEWFGRTGQTSGALGSPGLLTDSLTGVLGAALVASLLMRRATEGGSYRADVTLAGIGMWLQDLGEIGDDARVVETLGEPTRRRIHSCFGTLEYVAPAIRFSGIDPLLSRPPQPVGSFPPVWAVD